MLFHTPQFAAFFLLTFSIVWALRRYHTAWKWALIGASFVFYGAWSWGLSSLLLLSAVVNFSAARAMEGLGPRARKLILQAAIVFNLGLLCTFKYANFFLDSAGQLVFAFGLDIVLPYLDVILPIGISFYTFQGLSYVVDVYRRDVAPSRALSDVLLYLSFFPQLIAGPIVRAGNLLPQIRAGQDGADGVRRIALGFGIAMILAGLFKKIVLANWIATDLVDEVFFDPSAYGPLDLWLAAYGYSVQIYCDFSGYSDMAIGLAALLGFHIPRNFDQPFRAASMREFWRRWHISLSTWLRDYLYIPLGGSKKGLPVHLRALALTMLLGGLWHGAAWTFILWGAAHAAFLCGGVLWRRARLPSPGRIVGTVITLHLVVLTFVLFRSENIGLFREFALGLVSTGPDPIMVTPFALGLVGFGIAMHFLPPHLKETGGAALESLPWWAIGVLGGLILVTIGALSPPGVTAFIYFQF